MGLRQSSAQKQYDQFRKLQKEQILKEMELYRNRNPAYQDDPNLTDNLKFYTNQLPLKSEGLFVDELHEQWWADYRKLEDNHDYIQWLFPTQSKNPNCQQLQLHESQAIIADSVAHRRVFKSYKLMLDFFGIRLLDEAKGIVDRADHWSLHNSLRITRILKSLGELGYEHLKYPLLEFLLKEVLKHGTLRKLQDSLVNYWIQTLQDDNDREFLLCIAQAVIDKYHLEDVAMNGDNHDEQVRKQLRGALIVATHPS
ncbi:opioid growth factor receptor-like protein 1 isoform X2 [Ornithodoros turicata]|uniref:opioid growth factor receptor-like protein 1 isoform X2 n=1 Tax=Ornithodoros turicata TaxID=34597 RepID=UPI0031396AB1